MKCENPTCGSDWLIKTFTIVAGYGGIQLVLCGACRMQLSVALNQLHTLEG